MGISDVMNDVVSALFPGLTFPGVDGMPVVLIGAAVVAFLLSLFDTKSSSSSAPWLMKPSKVCGFLWLPFFVEVAHHLNAMCITEELKNPGWSAIGRMNHHLIDGMCHTMFIIIAGACYASAAGKGLPKKSSLIVLVMIRMMVEQWDIFGISYRLKFHEPSNAFERPSSIFEVCFIPNNDFFNPMELNGLTYWTYTFGFLGSIAFLCGASSLWYSKKGLIPQMVFILFMVFNPAANMLFGGSEVTPLRTYSLHFAHCADYLCWQTGFWIWLGEKITLMQSTIPVKTPEIGQKEEI